MARTRAARSNSADVDVACPEAAISAHGNVTRPTAARGGSRYDERSMGMWPPGPGPMIPQSIKQFRPKRGGWGPILHGSLQAVFVFTRLHLDARMSWVDAPHRPYDARHAHGAGTLMHRSSRYLKSCEVGFCRAPSRPDESRSVSISRRSVCGLSLATPYRHWTTGRFASR